ncbi:unnamed protein product [Protopolystoma xenopodis]|uniref:Uncharacterized protein n=1 Tax=Protopolystoma xenopodis TaxID=117903 RepID=A0A3S5CLE1_9PLAT|nr:unnamed protein product [Protopolystoma xenopodis]
MERAIATGDPFPCLDALVLRDMFLPRSGWSPDLASSGLTTCEFPLTDESSGTSSQFQGLRTWSERWLQTSRPSTLENRWTVVLTPSSQTGDPINRIQTASSLPCSTLSLADIPSPLCGNVSYHGPEALLDSYVTRDWRRVSLLLCLAELLSARRLGYPPLSPAGVGLGASVREVTHVNPAPTVRTADLPIKPFDVFAI